MTVWRQVGNCHQSVHFSSFMPHLEDKKVFINGEKHRPWHLRTLSYGLLNSLEA